MCCVCVRGGESGKVPGRKSRCWPEKKGWIPQGWWRQVIDADKPEMNVERAMRIKSEKLIRTAGVRQGAAEGQGEAAKGANQVAATHHRICM